MKCSVVIKALNEAGKISRCLESVLDATRGMDAEVILVDSLSDDSTVKIAKNYPIRIVQMTNINDRCCGAAAQLGFQVSLGDYVYLIDGDMELAPDFLAAAVTYLDRNPDVAGVAGLLWDTSILTQADRKRVAEYSKLSKVVSVESLGGGGLYRRSAILDVGYFSHRALRACEERELGIRLIAKGWKLIRLPILGVQHTGHQEDSLGAMRRLWANGRFAAHGVFLRSAVGHPWLWLAVRGLWYVFIPPMLLGWALIVLLSGAFSVISMEKALFLMGLPWLSVLAALSLKKKGKVGDAVVSILLWHLVFAASIGGVLTHPKDPLERISFEEIG